MTGTMLYDQSDLEAVYQRGAWNNWATLRRWIEREGVTEADFSPAQVHDLAEDIECLEEQERAFTADPREAYELLRQHCTHRG